ncbi:MAG: glutamate racemase [Anaerolineales bacterium]
MLDLFWFNAPPPSEQVRFPGLRSEGYGAGDTLEKAAIPAPVNAPRDCLCRRLTNAAARSNLGAMRQRPCGIFDSGVGGLSILHQIQLQLPNEALLYFADQAHVPYGDRSLEEIRSFSEAITRFLLEQGAKLIVVACNTASAAALHHLRAAFPEIPFVGMEPALKPAVSQTKTGTVGLLATPATLQGKLLASVMERFATGIRVLEQPLSGMVEQIEAGDIDGPETRAILERALQPLLAQNADTLVLACTHYPFLIPLIAEIAGPGVQVIDPSPAIARQTSRLLQQRSLSAPVGAGDVTLFTSGDPSKLSQMAARLIGLSVTAIGVSWHNHTVVLSP